MKLTTKDKLDLTILALIMAIAGYYFFQITEGWIFWLDVVVIVACLYLGRRILRKRKL